MQEEEDLGDEEYEQNESDEVEAELEPVYSYTIKGPDGTPAKTAGLTWTLELIRRREEVEWFGFDSKEDGTIQQWRVSKYLPWMPGLRKSLVLPSNPQEFGTTRQLFDSMVALLEKHVMLPRKESSLVAYWSMATWLADCLPFLPCLAISGPASVADSLLRTLVLVCHRPLILADASPVVLRVLSPVDLMPTLLIREPQLTRRTAALLDASSQRGVLVLTGQDFQPVYCPKCIYVGDHVKDELIPRNRIQIYVGGSSLGPPHQLPSEDLIRDFQNRLFTYRLLAHDKVAASQSRVSGLQPELCAMAEVLGAAIVDDPELQHGVIDLFKERDEQSRVDCASGLNAVVLRSVLFHCHQNQEQKVFVREIAATANRIYGDEGESLKVGSETVGHVLKYLGLYSRRLGNAGRGLVLDKATQSQAHRLASEHEVLDSEPRLRILSRHLENCLFGGLGHPAMRVVKLL